MQKGNVYTSTEDYLNSIHDIVANGGCWNDYKCNCYDMQPMRFITKSGTKRAAMVCTICGRREMNGVKSSDFSNFDDLPVYDMEWIKDEAHARHKSGFDLAISKGSKNNNTFWEAYGQYLYTDKWRAKSRKVLARDPVCKACNSRPSTQAHHTTYKHMFNEPLFDLIGVCEKCHETITKMDRNRKDKSMSMIAEEYLAGELEL